VISEFIKELAQELKRIVIQDIAGELFGDPTPREKMFFLLGMILTLLILQGV
jgi:hypothetical protein